MLKNNRYFIIDPAIQQWMFPMVNIGTSLYFIYWSITHFNLYSLLSLFLCSLLLGCVISLFAHRAWSHKSWTPNSLIEFFGLLIFTLTMTGSSVGWVSTHRQHHIHSDTENDPHSPYYVSRWKIQFMLWDDEIQPYCIKDIIKKSLHVWFLKYYWFVNLAWLTILYFINIDWLMFWFAVIGLTQLKQHGINTFCHNTPKFLLPINSTKSANVLLLVLTNPGECWHKNHHDYPSSWNFGRKWYEIDLPALIIKLLCLVGLASIP